MANLQGAPQQSTLVSSPTPTPSAPPSPPVLPKSQGDLGQMMQTGVNVPNASFTGEPYVPVSQGAGRTDYVSPSANIASALDTGAVPMSRDISPRDARAIDTLVQNEQGTTNRDILNTPDNYSDAVRGMNEYTGGGANGMSPNARGQASTPGKMQADITPSRGRERGVDRILTEDAGQKYYPGERADQGSTAMRSAGAKGGSVSPIAGEYAPYTPKEIRKASPAETIVPTTPTKPEAVVPAPAVNPDTERMRALIRRQESGSFGGDYAAKAKSSSASGAYQFVDKTWRSAAKDAGVGAEYRHAYQAPKAVQDKVFDHYFGKLMDRTNGDFYKAVNIHFTGNPEGRLSAAGKRANPTINSQGYRSAIARHEAEYDKLKSTVATR